MQLRRSDYLIPDGDAGTAATVDAMAALMRAGAVLPIVQQTAAMLLTTVPRDSDPAHYAYHAIGAIREFVANRWQFRDDPPWAETLYSPEVQLQMIDQAGVMRADCDDAAILFGALGLALGFETRIICVAFLTNDAPFSHTWSELRPATGGAAWIEGDVTRTMQAIPTDHITRITSTLIQPIAPGSIA